MELFPLGPLFIAYTIIYAVTLYAIEKGRLPDLMEFAGWIASSDKRREIFALGVFSVIILLMGIAGLLVCGYKDTCSLRQFTKGALIGVTAMVVGLRLLLHALLYNEESKCSRSNLLDLMRKISKIGVFPSGPSLIRHALIFFEFSLLVLAIHALTNRG